jgi:hypothetical protein
MHLALFCYFPWVDDVQFALLDIQDFFMQSHQVYT